MTLPGHAADLATGIGETATEAINRGRGRAREMMVTAEGHVPDSAIDWTREHVPGLTPRRRATRPPRLIVVMVLLTIIAVVMWWLQRSTGDASQQQVGNAGPANDRDPESATATAGR